MTLVISRKIYEEAKRRGIDIDKKIKEGKVKVVEDIKIKKVGGK